MTERSEILGNFIEIKKRARECMVLCFSSDTLVIDELWDNSFLSAKFLSNFWGTFFPAHDKASKSRRAEMEDSVWYISAELMSNAVKFSHTPDFIIRIEMHMLESELRFYSTNSVAPGKLVEFKSFIKILLEQDPHELYLAQMEKNVEEDGKESRMGYLTMMLNYEANLAWKFHIENNMDVVTTMVGLPVVRNI